jgi:hypothetical protein
MNPSAHLIEQRERGCALAAELPCPSVSPRTSPVHVASTSTWSQRRSNRRAGELRTFLALALLAGCGTPPPPVVQRPRRR